MGTFLDFPYFSSYLQTKETAWKRSDTVFSEPETLRSSLGEFKNFLKIKKLKRFDSPIIDT